PCVLFGIHRVSVLLETALCESQPEGPAADRLLAGLMRPGDVGLVEGASRRASLRGDGAAIADEAAQHVHMAAVGVCRGPDVFRWVQPDPLPLRAALDGPREDPGALLEELVGELGVALLGGNGHRE